MNQAALSVLALDTGLNWDAGAQIFLDAAIDLAVSNKYILVAAIFAFVLGRLWLYAIFLVFDHKIGDRAREFLTSRPGMFALGIAWEAAILIFVHWVAYGTPRISAQNAEEIAFTVLAMSSALQLIITLLVTFFKREAQEKVDKETRERDQKKNE